MSRRDKRCLEEISKLDLLKEEQNLLMMKKVNREAYTKEDVFLEVKI